MVLHCWFMISLLTMLEKQPTDACLISPKHFVFSTTSNTTIWSDWRVDASEPAAALITWDRICHHITLYFRWHVKLHLFYKSCLPLCYKCKHTFQHKYKVMWWQILSPVIRAAAGSEASTRQSDQIAVFDVVEKTKCLGEIKRTSYNMTN